MLGRVPMSSKSGGVRALDVTVTVPFHDEADPVLAGEVLCPAP